MTLATDHPKPQQRFRALVMVNHRRHGAFEAFGLYRSSVLAQTALFECYCRADSVLFVRERIAGKIHQTSAGAVSQS